MFAVDVILHYDACLPCGDRRLTFIVYPPFTYLWITSFSTASTLSSSVCLSGFRATNMRSGLVHITWQIQVKIWAGSAATLVCLSLSLSSLCFSQPNDHWRNPHPVLLKKKKKKHTHTPAPQSTLPSAMISCTSIAERQTVSDHPPHQKAILPGHHC